MYNKTEKYINFQNKSWYDKGKIKLENTSMQQPLTEFHTTPAVLIIK